MHKWEFRNRFRRNAFGWRSSTLAVKRVKEAVSEINKIKKKEPLLAAEGAVIFLEKISPALEQVDSSSGSIGTAVNNAIIALVPIIAKAPLQIEDRDKWLNRLWQAIEDDQMPYIETLADHWGELCSDPNTASLWADKFIGTIRTMWTHEKSSSGYFKGTSACLSALHAANPTTTHVVCLSACVAFFFDAKDKSGDFALGSIAPEKWPFRCQTHAWARSL